MTFQCLTAMVVLSIAITHVWGSWNNPRKRIHDNADQSNENSFTASSKMPNINTGNQVQLYSIPIQQDQLQYAIGIT